MKHRDPGSLRIPCLAGTLMLLGLLAAAPAAGDERADEESQDARAEAFTPLESLFDSEPPRAEPADANGIYRFLGRNVKVGLSYSRAEFSGELASLSFEDHRVFLNVVGML